MTDIIGARDAPREGVTGKLVVDSLPPEVRAGWAPTPDDAAALALAWARPGDLVITFGVGEPWKIARAIVDGLPTMSDPRSQEGVALARLTTIGTGGPARAFAEPRTLAELEHALRGRARAGAAVSRRSGSARTCSPRTTAWTCSCCGSRASSPRRAAEGTMLAAGGGATNAVCLHRARAAGLGGFEFACAIPGTAGGGVWMNAGAYGSDWSAILVRALVATADGSGLADAGRARPLLPALEPPARPGRRRGRVPARAARPEPRSAPTVRDLVDAPQGDAADDEAHVRLGLQEPAGRARRRARCSSCAA